MAPNPYQPPSAFAQGAAPWAQPGAPSAPRLFTANAIALAAFLATPFAASCLYAANLKRTGRSQAAVSAVGLGAVATAVVFGLAFALPDTLTSLMTMLNLGMVAGVRALAQREFGGAIQAAEQVGVRPSSTWWAALVSVVVLIPIGGALFLVAFASQQSVTIAPEQEVVYEGGVTEREARAVGAALVEVGFFGPEAPGAKTATLSKEANAYTLAFYVQDGAWNDVGTRSAFVCVGGRVRGQALGKAKTFVLLMNDLGLEKSRAEAPLETEPAYAAACGRN